MKQSLHIKGQSFARWIVLGLCACWLLGATWLTISQPAPVTNAYSSYAAQLAKCRTKLTSQARYDCTSQIMLEKENSIFNKVMMIVLPPLGLLISYVLVIRVVTRRREEAASRANAAASRKRMQEWNKFIGDIKAGKAQYKPETFLDRSGKPIALPPHLAKRR